MSEREPELGLGVVAALQRAQVTIAFPATREKRIYALGTPVLKRVRFRVGESLVTRDGKTLVVEAVDEHEGLLTYTGRGQWVREDELSDVTSVSQPQERLMAGQVDPGEVFDLRYRALQAQARFRQSDVRGFLGGRLDLLPHQFYILQEVSSRQIPRALLADEVGLGKTIEACLIVQRLLVTGKARRVLILVPESLTHQWFVELLRRFNLWLGIYNEERCQSSEQSDPGQNPFLAGQLALCSISFLADNPARGDQAVEAGWDMVVVDEAHHLAWAPENPSPAYALVERFGQSCPGMLLLTATPTQLGLTGHFARLRLLDPHRYSDYETFVGESERFAEVAGIAGKILDQKALKPADHAKLQAIFNRAPERLAQHLAALAEGKPGARQALLKTLLDQHGTGRVMFRNTRAAVAGFPKRKFCPVPLAENNLTRLARIARELQAEETAGDSSIRYAYKDDPRIEWLAGFLKANRSEKVLLICKSQRKVLAIEAALQEKMSAKAALFHEDLQLVQRDRNAAWFAEPDGAQLLLCSEIGSEGRNFQFAHHLVLFDLPLNPGLLEQRIGRLDRIGQTQTIRIHVPYVTWSSDEYVVEWYHRGVEAFERPVHGGDDYQRVFKARLVELALEFGESGDPAGKPGLEALIEDTAKFGKELTLKLAKGRDRLLEMASFDRPAAARVIERIQAVDTDPFLRRFLLALLDHFGVRVKEEENGDVFLDPSHAYIEGFPSIPADGMLATFDRRRATSREDIRFISADHSLVQDAIDLLVDSKAGTTAFSFASADKPNLLVEVVFVLETVSDSRWHVDHFLAPTPVRVVSGLRGGDLTAERDSNTLALECEDGDIHRFLERPEFSPALLNQLVEAATRSAELRAEVIRSEAGQKALESLGADLKRLVDLRAVNDHVRADEIDLAQEQIERTRTAIAQARLRLDSVRLVMEGPGGL